MDVRIRVSVCVCVCVCVCVYVHAYIGGWRGCRIQLVRCTKWFRVYSIPNSAGYL